MHYAVILCQVYPIQKHNRCKHIQTSIKRETSGHKTWEWTCEYNKLLFAKKDIYIPDWISCLCCSSGSLATSAIWLGDARRMHFMQKDYIFLEDVHMESTGTNVCDDRHGNEHVFGSSSCGASFRSTGRRKSYYHLSPTIQNTRTNVCRLTVLQTGRVVKLVSHYDEWISQ